MSTSPLPPDPYEALGVTKECDIDEIKKAHRKLVLKHHPDRIKDPALVEQGKIEFHKVQQAYELLIDPVRRERYHDQCRLAQLRKERMMDQTREPARDSPARNSYPRSSYPTQPPPQSYTPRRETPSQQSRPTPQPMYEERAPADSYFTDIPKYDEPLPRGHPRKADIYERRTSAARPAEKSSPKPKTNGWDRPSGGGGSGKSAGSTINMVFGLKKSVDAAKKKVQEKESHARAAKARDVEQHRERDNKQNYARYTPQVEDDSGSSSSESSSDDEPVAPGRRNLGRDRSPAARDIERDRSPARNPRPRSPVRKLTRERSPAARPIGRERSPSATLRSSAREKSPIPKSQPHLTPDYAKKRATSPRPAKAAYFDVEHESPDEQHDAWQEKHRSATEYLHASRKSTRPTPSRQNSDIDQYWAGEHLRDHKRSGSDSDRQRERERPQPVHKSSSSHRRSAPQEYPEPHRPGLSTQHSAPAANMRSMAYESAPRPRQNSYDPRDPKAHRREMGDAMPPLHRSGSSPIPRTESKRDTTAPIRSSGLKQETNHDSGYGSGSAPHTPETGGDSPPNEREKEREREVRPGPKRESSKIYKVSRDAQDSHRAPKVTPSQAIVEEDPPLKRYLSPEDYTSRPGEAHHERRASRTNEEDRSRPNRASERRPSMTRNDTHQEERPSRAKHSQRSPERSSSRTVPLDSNTVKYATQRAAPPRYASYHEPASSRHHSHHRHSDAKPRALNLFGQLVG